MVSQEWGDIQITHEMTDDSAPISEAGRFLRFYFNYYEAVVIGSTVKFRFDVLYATNSIGAEIDAKAEGTHTPSKLTTAKRPCLLQRHILRTTILLFKLTSTS